MLVRKIVLGMLAGVFACLSVKAQTFETRSTRFYPEIVLNKLDSVGHSKQITIRDSVLEVRSGSLGITDTIETFFNDYHLGLVIYRNGTPFKLLGFWDPNGKLIDGGHLDAGTGVIKTPFNPNEVRNFKNESIVYVGGIKNGACFYYCDCASVLRKGTFERNEKIGLWKEYHVSGKFIKQKRIEVPLPPPDFLIDIRKDLIQPAHCMMQRDIKECPNLELKKLKKG